MDAADRKRRVILRAERARLRRDLLRMQELNASPDCAGIVDHAAAAVFRLHRDGAQLQAAVAHATTELTNDRRTLAAETALLRETRTIHTSLSETLRQLEITDPATRVQSAVDAKRTELGDLRKLTSQSMGRLLKFLEAYYPSVGAPNASPVQKRARLLDAPPPPTSFSLKDMIEDLMNLSVSDDHGPYYRLEEGHYHGPYVQLLLDAGVVTYHPKDATRIRLVDFGG
ncbi:hypothetical protein IWQ60_002114 [Tieghemiomyces parasiticus]|uniref:Uncharacterized protein n=1 Tax=Tieghemiomyces parasiticus TaxID=78921 RepID=A0A9W8E1Y3_9FUNG|nr:hypothetical protein IWQ60_002114 [Tieghemiomyces parasiticus]